MIDFESMIKIFFVLILIVASFAITRRDILAIITSYSLQSLLISILAVMLFLNGGSRMLMALALLTLLSKWLIIPFVMKRIQKRIKIKRDVEFNYFSPTSALGVSILLILAGYLIFSRILEGFALSSLFVFGAVVGISLMLMGLLIIFSRRQTITNIVGYLTMENGVLVTSLFLTELPLLIEVLITVDLISLILLATILSFRINADIDEYSAKFSSPFAWPGDEE